MLNFAGNGNTAHVSTANNEMDAILPEIGRVLIPTSKELASLREAAGSYRSSLLENLQKVLSEAAKSLADLQALSTKVAELSSSIDAEKARVASTIAEYQSQFSGAQDARASAFTLSEKDREAKFTAALTDQSGQVKAELAKASTELEEAREQRRKHLSDLAQEYEGEAKKALERIEAHERQVEKLVGVIGNLGFASGYQKAADEARGQKYMWQAIAVAALLAVITFAFLAFLPSLQRQTEFSWPNFAGRIVLTLAVGVLAGYAAAEAAKNQDAERRNRKRALELESIGPYLAPLPDEEQIAVRKAIAERSFGIEEVKPENLPTPSPTNVGHLIASSDLTKIFEAVIEGFVKVAKK